MRKIIQLMNNKLYKQALEAAEKEVYLAAHLYSGGNQTQTAKLLGVSRGTVITKLKQWGTI